MTTTDGARKREMKMASACIARCGVVFDMVLATFQLQRKAAAARIVDVKRDAQMLVHV